MKRKPGRKPLPPAAYMQYVRQDGLTDLINRVEEAYPDMRAAAVRTRIIEAGCYAMLKAAKQTDTLDDLTIEGGN